ncbi:hypothetical protein OC845_003797 [Tilletia horrida]|nr:hypothetical protein OC845_003797 [Tilletia horrida]
MTSFSTYASRFLSSAYGPFRTEEEEAQEAAAAAAAAAASNNPQHQQSQAAQVTAGTGSSRLIGRGASSTSSRILQQQPRQSSSRRPANLDSDPLFYSALYGYDPLHQHPHHPPPPTAAAGAGPSAHPFGGDPFGDPYEEDEEYHHNKHDGSSSHSSHTTDDEHDPSDSRNLQSVALPRDSHWARGKHPVDNRSSILNPTPHSSQSGSSLDYQPYEQHDGRYHRGYRDDEDDDEDDDRDEEEYWNSEEEDEMLNQEAQQRSSRRRRSRGEHENGDEDDDDDADHHLSQSGRVIYVQPPPVDLDEGWGPWFTRMTRGTYHDKNAAVAFATFATFTFLIAGGVALGAKPQSAPESPSTRPSSYYTITRTLPILILLTLLSVVASLANLWLLRHVAQRVGPGAASLRVSAQQQAEEEGVAKMWVRNALLAVPAVLGLGWVWALAGSFVYDDEQWSGGGWSTTGLRLLSLIPLVMALLFARSVYKRRAALSRSIAVLELSCSILLAHPHIFLIALIQLGIFILLTIPFLTIFARLFLIGHFSSSAAGDKKVWITSARAAWLAWITFGTWMWTWAMLRGIQRVTIAGVVSHWYFHRSASEGVDANAPPSAAQKAGVSAEAVSGDHESAGPTPGPGAWLAEEDQPRNRSGNNNGLFPPSPEDVVRASLARATGPALGTIALASLVLSLLRLATLTAWCARRISKAIAREAERQMLARGMGPISLGVDNLPLGMGGVGRFVASRGVSMWLQPVGHGAAVLAGLTAVAQSVSEYVLIYTGVTGEAFWKGARRAGRLVSRHGVKGVMDGLIINLLLDMTTIALSLLAGVAGFLFSAHQLHVPADAPLVGLLCAAVPYWTLRLCADVLRNAADTIYLCWAIDRQLKDEHCAKADEAFQTQADGHLPF